MGLLYLLPVKAKADPENIDYLHPNFPQGGSKIINAAHEEAQVFSLSSETMSGSLTFDN